MKNSSLCGEHASPGYELGGWTLDVWTQSFEPGDVLIRNEYLVADRFRRSHYKPFDRISQRVF